MDGVQVKQKVTSVLGAVTHDVVKYGTQEAFYGVRRKAAFLYVCNMQPVD